MIACYGVMKSRALRALCWSWWSNHLSELWAGAEKSKIFDGFFKVGNNCARGWGLAQSFYFPGHFRGCLFGHWNNFILSNFLSDLPSFYIQRGENRGYMVYNLCLPYLCFLHWTIDRRSNVLCFFEDFFHIFVITGHDFKARFHFLDGFEEVLLEFQLFGESSFDGMRMISPAKLFLRKTSEDPIFRLCVLILC